MATTQVPKDAAANLDVDYVISYRFADTNRSSAMTKLARLIAHLHDHGFDTAVRTGDKHSILIFVKLGSHQHLYAQVFRSRVQDWLHGVRSSPPDETSHSLEKEPLYPAERLRIIYQIITNPAKDGGVGITPKNGEWQEVESIFALHEEQFNKAWLKKWATTYMLRAEDLDDIRDRFGEKIAFYFAFTQSYFTALIGISTFGLTAWLMLGYFSSVYAIINSLLCVCFVEYWKHQELDFAVRWGVRGVSSIETKRHDFASERWIKDPVTGETVQFFSTPRRLARQLLQIPFALIAVVVLGTVLATSFAIEIFISEIYTGPFKSVLVFLPTGILTTTQPLLLGILNKLAVRLTKFENYEHDSDYEAALTQKIFVLNFISSYIPICLTAFVYVPFAEVLVPYLDIFSLTVRPFADSKTQMQTPASGFHIDPARLRRQVIYFTTTAQVVNLALELIVPYVKRTGFSKYKEYQSERTVRRGGTNKDPAADDLPEEAVFLKRVRKEAELGVYDVTTDFREMVVQYGYLSLFSVVWPLTGASFLFNNWLELRADAVKICNESQRPTPWRADGIGPWIDSLGFLTWVGSITTAAIVYLFSNDGLGPDGSPKDVRGWALLLCIFFSEHSYLATRWAVGKAISKLDSPGRQRERRERYALRKQYLEDITGDRAGRIASKLAGEQVGRDDSVQQGQWQGLDASRVPMMNFWSRQRSWQETAQVGAAMIERAAAPEGKKEQ